MARFKEMTLADFKKYIETLKVSRNIKRIQLHHTYSPSYKNFNGKNHQSLQEGIRNYHINSNGWNDIGQHYTIFPDGKILTGRDMNKTPAGIYGANTGGICIECLGNFDAGGDVMTNEQKESVVGVVRMLLDKFGLTAEDGVTYHCWWSADGRELGDYVKGHSVKSCPSVNFFGGNTLTAYHNNLMPLIKEYGKRTILESGNDIVWELMNGKHKIEINEVERAIKSIDKARENTEYCPLYWLLYKIVNK